MTEGIWGRFICHGVTIETSPYYVLQGSVYAGDGKTASALFEKNDLHRASQQFCFFYELYHGWALKIYS